MRQRLKLFLIATSLLLAGFALAQEPPGNQPDDPPVRLKKKKPDPSKTEPVKPAQPEKKAELPKKDKDAPKEDPEPPAPQEDEAEVLNRVAKNVRLADEKLANKELNDATRQLQDDILKDLDSLIRAAESPQSGGGADQSQDPMNNQDQSKSSGKSQSGGAMNKQSGGKSSSSSRAMRRRQGNGSQQANKGGKQNGSGEPSGSNSQNKGQPGEQANGKNNNGNNGGGGGKSMPGSLDKNADLYKDVWGHLPEALRAEMNAYSNDKQFMAKYDELIKRYYRTIAEQGRRKGD